MDRKARGRSATRKEKETKKTTSKSPKGRPAKSPVKSAKPARGRSRGRPRLTSKEREARARSRSRSVSQARPPGRPKRTPKKVVEYSEDDEPLVDKARLRLNDIMKTNPKKSLDEIIRESVERETTLRRSTRIPNRVERTITRTDEWRKETTTTLSSAPTSIYGKKQQEFGGVFGVLSQSTILTLIVASLLLGCTKEQCSFAPFHIPRNWRFYLNVQAALGVAAFFIAQLVFLILPIGRVVQCSGGASYRANGMLSLLLTGAGVAGLWYQGYPVTLAYERHVQAATATYILIHILALVLFIKGGRAAVPGLNPYGNSGSRLYDFMAGREVNPMLFGRINVKILCLRVCVIGTALLDWLLAVKGYEVRKEWSPTLLTLVVLKSLYTLDVLWFEDSFSSTFESQYEGMGLMEVKGLLLYPFYTAILPRFVLAYRVERPAWVLAVSALWFTIGYSVYRASNLQKALFRKNPMDPAVAKLETIPTSRGKRLLVSGWWGIVKHPNYLGDIILHWAMATTIGFTHGVPYIIPMVTTLFLLHRAKRDGVRCSERYQEAWKEYDRRVPYKVIPYVY